jgi:hypothetical protein
MRLVRIKVNIVIVVLGIISCTSPAPRTGTRGRCGGFIMVMVRVMVMMVLSIRLASE